MHKNFHERKLIFLVKPKMIKQQSSFIFQLLLPNQQRAFLTLHFTTFVLLLDRCIRKTRKKYYFLIFFITRNVDSS